MGILEHHSNVPPQLLPLYMAHIHAVDGDGAGLDIVKPVQQVGDGGLSSPGGAHKGDLLSRSGVKADVL